MDAWEQNLADEPQEKSRARGLAALFSRRSKERDVEQSALLEEDGISALSYENALKIHARHPLEERISRVAELAQETLRERQSTKIDAALTSSLPYEKPFIFREPKARAEDSEEIKKFEFPNVVFDEEPAPQPKPKYSAIDSDEPALSVQQQRSEHVPIQVQESIAPSEPIVASVVAERSKAAMSEFFASPEMDFEYAPIVNREPRDEWNPFAEALGRAVEKHKNPEPFFSATSDLPPESIDYYARRNAQPEASRVEESNVEARPLPPVPLEYAYSVAMTGTQQVQQTEIEPEPDTIQFTATTEQIEQAVQVEQAEAPLESAEAEEPLSPHPGLECKNVSITLRVSRRDAEMLKQRAEASGLTLSAYIRSCTLEAEMLRAQVKSALAEMRTARSQAPTMRKKSTHQRTWWNRLVAQHSNA